MISQKDRRRTDRRLTDEEIEAVLLHARGYLNGAKKRAWTVGGLISASMAVLTIVQTYLLAPIREDMAKLEQHYKQIDVAVRDHHENSAKEYVLRPEWETSQRDLERTVNRLVADVAEIKGTLIHIGQVKR